MMRTFSKSKKVQCASAVACFLPNPWKINGGSPVDGKREKDMTIRRRDLNPTDPANEKNASFGRRRDMIRVERQYGTEMHDRAEVEKIFLVCAGKGIPWHINTRGITSTIVRFKRHQQILRSRRVGTGRFLHDSVGRTCLAIGGVAVVALVVLFYTLFVGGSSASDHTSRFFPMRDSNN